MFNNVFGSEQRSRGNVDWKILSDVSQVVEITEASRQTPILIFKHSTRCGISRMTLKRFESEFDLENKITPYFLDLLQYRDVSNYVSTHFDVVHQSPQVLLIKDGKCIYDASHDAIDASTLETRV